MGAVHSKKDETKMSLADRRYRVSVASKAVVNTMHRRSTRKMGSVALEVQQGQEETQPTTTASGRMGNSRERDEEEAAEKGEQEQQQQQQNNISSTPAEEDEKKREIITNRHRSQTLLHFPLSRTENAANAAILLTRTQRVLLENSWKRVKKAAVEGGIGAKVFHNVLIAQPDIKLLFGLEKVPQGRLKYEGQFRRHAGLLSRTLEYIIKNVQYTDKLGQHFKALGKKHCQMNGGRAFPANYWDIFLECILQSVLESDGSISGRYHRCREAAFAWRTLISFIVQQMRRGFDDERLMRKRFSASLMGLRGSALRESIENVPSLRASSGRPRPSLFQHAHGSLGSLEMMSALSHSHRHNNPLIVFYQTDGSSSNQRRERAVSTQQNQKQNQCPPNDGGNGRLQPRPAAATGDGNGCAPSARSASWCAEVSGEEFRRLQLNDRCTKRATRSELVIDDNYEETFYTPTTQLKPERHKAREASLGVSSDCSSPLRCCSPSPRVISTVQLLLSAASFEPSADEGMAVSLRTQSTLELPNDCEKNSQARHSFSEFADRRREKVAAIEASKRMLELAQQNQLQMDEEDSAGEQRRLSAV